jgi:hypothetical protein
MAIAAELLDNQLKVAPEIGFPLPSLAVATNCTVCPANNDLESGEIEIMTGGGPPFVILSPLHATMHRTDETDKRRSAFNGSIYGYGTLLITIAD